MAGALVSRASPVLTSAAFSIRVPILKVIGATEVSGPARETTGPWCVRT